MDETSILKEFGMYGIGGILAGIIFWFYIKREKEHKEFVIECIADKAEQNSALVTVVKDNTAAMTKNTTVIEALHRRLDGELRHHRDNDRFTTDSQEH